MIAVFIHLKLRLDKISIIDSDDDDIETHACYFHFDYLILRLANPPKLYAREGYL